jgi:hypothetical protein
MFNILHHKENANSNDTVIPSYPSQHSFHQENKQQMLIGWGGRYPYALSISGIEI